jgi:hypothetical protein
MIRIEGGLTRSALYRHDLGCAQGPVAKQHAHAAGMGIEDEMEGVRSRLPITKAGRAGEHAKSMGLTAVVDE